MVVVVVQGGGGGRYKDLQRLGRTLDRRSMVRACHPSFCTPPPVVLHLLCGFAFGFKLFLCFCVSEKVICS